MLWWLLAYKGALQPKLHLHHKKITSQVPFFMMDICLWELQAEFMIRNYSKVPPNHQITKSIAKWSWVRKGSLKSTWINIQCPRKILGQGHQPVSKAQPGIHKSRPPPSRNDIALQDQRAKVSLDHWIIFNDGSCNIWWNSRDGICLGNKC